MYLGLDLLIRSKGQGYGRRRHNRRQKPIELHLVGFNKWESVKSFICGLGKLDFWHIHMQLVVRFIEAVFL